MASDKDELRSCELCNDDYTLKIYQKGDGRCYAVVVYETDDDSIVLCTTRIQENVVKAKALGTECIKKHMKEMKK